MKIIQNTLKIQKKNLKCLKKQSVGFRETRHFFFLWPYQVHLKVCEPIPLMSGLDQFVELPEHTKTSENTNNQ